MKQVRCRACCGVPASSAVPLLSTRPSRRRRYSVGRLESVSPSQLIKRQTTGSGSSTPTATTITNSVTNKTGQLPVAVSKSAPPLTKELHSKAYLGIKNPTQLSNGAVLLRWEHAFPLSYFPALPLLHLHSSSLLQMLTTTDATRRL